MSFILEALRRAEAERERQAGGVPNILAQPAPPVRPVPAAPRRRATLRPFLLAAAAALIVAAVAWWFAGRTGDRVAGSPPPPGAVVAPAAAPPAAAVAVPGAADPPASTPATAPTARLRLADTAPMPAPPADAPPPRQEAPRPAATDATRPMKPAELAPDVRRSLPTLSFGGSVHSPDAAARLLIVDGQVRRQGDTVAPGMILLEIRAKSAVFDFKGQRVELPL